MKVLISADMEGTAGVVDRAHTAIPDRAAITGVQHNAAEYDWARRLMTEEVNAAIAGAFEGGATEVWTWMSVVPSVSVNHRSVSGPCLLPGLTSPPRRTVSPKAASPFAMAGNQRFF